LSRYEVVDDPDPDGQPSAIRTYLECLRRTPDCTHRLILQDDVELVRDFDVRVRVALLERPGQLVAFFVPGMGLPGRWMREAARSGRDWLEFPTSVNWRPTVALCWPVSLVPEFLIYAEEYIAHRLRLRKGTLWDDPVVGGFCRLYKLPVWATVPCLVQHPDLVPSLVKRRSYLGLNPARKAAVFVAD
jgi:hypothetical protein